MNNVDQAEQDIQNGAFSYEGVIGLVSNFSCYTRTYTYDKPAELMREQFEWCEQNYGEHKKRWLFIPNVIEKYYVYWFFSKKKEMTLFQLAWETR
jgi:hypothetical protein